MLFSQRKQFQIQRYIYPSTESSLIISFTLNTTALYMYISMSHCNLHCVPQYYYGLKPIHFKLLTFKYLIPSILHDLAGHSSLKHLIST